VTQWGQNGFDTAANMTYVQSDSPGGSTRGQSLMYMIALLVNFGPLAAEIISLVWGTPANFNGFRFLAALLHGTPVLGVSQTLRS